MSATRAPVGGAPSVRPGGVGSLPTRQRRPGLVALAVALIVGCAAVAGSLYARAGQKTAVVVVAREVPPGQVIERADLSTVAVAGAVTAVGAQNLDSLVGQTAAVTWLPGMLVQRSMVSPASPLKDGSAAVGVALQGGQLPADGVDPGDTVAVLQVPTAALAGRGSAGGGGGGSGAQVLVDRAQVWSARPDPAKPGGTLVTVLVPSGAYVDVAAASGMGQVALVEVPPA